MRSRKILGAISIWIVLFGSIAFAGDAEIAEEIKAARQTLDTAFQNGDGATIRNMVTPDHIGVTSYNPGAFSADEQIAALPKFEGRYFDFTETKIDILGPDAVMITFENALSGTYDGKPLPARISVVEIWTRISGKWLQKYYQQTPIAE